MKYARGGIVLFLLLTATALFPDAAYPQPTALWAHTFDSCTAASDVAALADGAIVAAGELEETLCLIGVHADGTVGWDRKVDLTGSLESLEGGVIAAVPDGGFIVGATGVLEGIGRGVLIRFEGDGAELWRRVVMPGSSDGFIIEDIAVAADGYLIAGYRPGSSAPGNDGALVRTDSDGNLVRERRAKRNSDDAEFLHDVEITADGRVWVAGIAYETVQGDTSGPAYTVMAEVTEHGGEITLQTLSETEFSVDFHLKAELLVHEDGRLTLLGRSADEEGLRIRTFHLNADGELQSEAILSTTADTIVVADAAVLSRGEFIISGREEAAVGWKQERRSDAVLLKEIDGGVAYERRIGNWWSDERIDAVASMDDGEFVVAGTADGQMFLTAYRDAAPTNAPAYFPLDVGNTWTYYTTIHPPGEQADTSFAGPYGVSESVMVNDTAYFVVGYPNALSDTLRKDDAGRVFGRIGGKDMLLFDFTAPDGTRYDFAKSQAGPYSEQATVSKGETIEVAAGTFENVISIRFDHPLIADGGRTYRFAEGVGIISTIDGMGEWRGLYSAVVSGRAIPANVRRPSRGFGGLVWMYPNPVPRGGVLVIHLADPSVVRTSIYDALGRRVGASAEQWCAVEGCRINVDVSGLAAGIYFVRMSSAGADRINPFVIADP